MAFVPVPNTVSVFFEHAGPDNVIVGNVFNFLYLDPPIISAAALNALGAELVTWWDAFMQPVKTAGYTLTRLLMRDLTDSNSFQVNYDTGLPLSGTLTGNSMPTNVAWSIKLGTGMAGRSRRGRIYHFGMSEDVVSGNFMDATHAATVLAAYEALLTDTGVLNDWRWVVVSRQQDEAPLLVGQTYPITDISAVDLRVDTQRKRLPD